jgi:hypothetical protein
VVRRRTKTERVVRAIQSPATRGTVMFVAGLGLTIREAFVHGPDRPSLYVVWMGMMGFPFVANWFEVRPRTRRELEDLRQLEKRSEPDDEHPDEPPSKRRR